MLLANVAFGVLAGLLAAHVRLHLALPGHKALFWMTPVLLARLLSRHPLGAMTGACAAACSSLAFGGSFAGGVVYLPLVVAAGGVLDALVAFAERRRLPALAAIPLVGLGGLVANLFCAANRLLVPVRKDHLLFGLSGWPATVLSYALFGLLGGLLGAALAAGMLALVRRRRRLHRQR
jgi:ABC-type thiamin/hydroxymethylpyrimidine transport system permease subunit